MDPSFWGNNAWDSLFIIAINYPTHPSINQKHAYLDFFKLLKIVLPCNECCSSINKFQNEINFKNYTDNQKSLFLGLYKLKNKVNSKLRYQGKYHKNDRTLVETEKYYINKFNNLNQWEHICWDFLFSISFSLPNNTPPNISNEYKHFFYLLMYTYPTTSGRESFKKLFLLYPYNENSISNNKILTTWLYQIYTKFPFNTPHIYTNYNQLCQEFLPKIKT
jgi:hypothetical protein